MWTPEHWPDALEALGRAFDSRYVTVVNVVGAGTGEVTCSRDALEAIERYLNKRDIPDSREVRVNPRLDEGFRTDLDDFSRAEIARDPFYQEFLRPLDIGWHAAAALPGFNDETLIISLKRAPTQGMFTAAQVAALNAALPRLRAVAQCLARAVEAATNGGTALPLVLHRSNGKRPLVVDVIGLPPGMLGDALSRHVLLVVNDLDRSPRPRPEVLRRIFEFTPREVDLALHLAAGKSLREAAAAMAISEGHARQRIKALLAKAACSNQADLRALLARLD